MLHNDPLSFCSVLSAFIGSQGDIWSGHTWPVHMKHSVKMQKLSWLQSFFLVLMVHIRHLIDSIFTSGPLWALPPSGTGLPRWFVAPLVNQSQQVVWKLEPSSQMLKAWSIKIRPWGLKAEKRSQQQWNWRAAGLLPLGFLLFNQGH